MTSYFLEWFIPALFMIAFTAMAYVVFTACRAGAEVYAAEYAANTSVQFEDIFLFIPEERIYRITWGLTCACFVGFFLLACDFRSLAGVGRGVVIGFAAALAAFAAPRRFLAILRIKRLRRFDEQLVDALITMSNALRAGFSITQSFESVVKEGLNPIAQEFSVMLHQLRVGVRFEDALVNLEKRVESEDLVLMVRSIEIARLTGGNLTEVFEKISETIRERMRIQGRIRSMTAQGKLQGIVVGAMPVLLGLLMFAIDPGMMLAFVKSAMGIIVLAVAAVFEIAGALLIRKIVRIDI